MAQEVFGAFGFRGSGLKEVLCLKFSWFEGFQGFRLWGFQGAQVQCSAVSTYGSVLKGSSLCA